MTVKKNRNHPLWMEAYRPSTVDETILPTALKDTFRNMVSTKSIPHLLLCGPSGCGKTTVALAMINELDADVLMINASLKGNIDTLRNEITNFATTMSWTGKRKFVVLDEADYLTPAVQPALRNFMEEHSENCGFILTCNHRSRIIPEVQGRCAVIEFKFSDADKKELVRAFFQRVCDILDNENVSYEKQVVAKVVARNIGNWRKTLNDLQRYSNQGPIDSGVLSVSSENTGLDTLIPLLRDKNFTDMRKWVADNIDTDSHAVFKEFYDTASTRIEKGSIPNLVILLAKYEDLATRAVNKEICMAAFLTEIMVECTFV